MLRPSVSDQTNNSLPLLAQAGVTVRLVEQIRSFSATVRDQWKILVNVKRLIEKYKMKLDNATKFIEVVNMIAACHSKISQTNL